MALSPGPRQLTVLQASQASPSLARLSELAQESQNRLRCVLPLIPAPLRSAIRSGPIDEQSWCLLLDNNAVAAKLRQLLPVLLQRLRAEGHAVERIRLKVQQPE